MDLYLDNIDLYLDSIEYIRYTCTHTHYSRRIVIEVAIFGRRLLATPGSDHPDPDRRRLFRLSEVIAVLRPIKVIRFRHVRAVLGHTHTAWVQVVIWRGQGLEITSNTKAKQNGRMPGEGQKSMC